MSSEPALLTIRQVARELQVSPRTLHRWIRNGEVSVVRLGKLVRIPQDELQRLIAVKA